MHSEVSIILAALSCFVIPRVTARCRSLGPDCLSPWRQLGNSCFLVTESTVQWSSARAECGKVNAVLAALRSMEEQDFVASMIPDWGIAWLDCNDLDAEGAWVCMEGQVEVSDRNWDWDQPNNRLGNEDCGGIYSEVNSGGDRGMHDFDCADSFHAVCKISLA